MVMPVAPCLFFRQIRGSARFRPTSHAGLELRGLAENRIVMPRRKPGQRVSKSSVRRLPKPLLPVGFLKLSEAEWEKLEKAYDAFTGVCRVRLIKASGKSTPPLFGICGNAASPTWIFSMYQMAEAGDP